MKVCKSAKVILLVTVLTVLVLSLCIVSAPRFGIANADVAKVFNVVQSEKVYYRSASYIISNKFVNFGEDGFTNELYDSLTVTLDGEKVVVPQQNFTITNVNEINIPKTYLATISISYGGEDYSKNLSIVISKAELRVIAKVNDSDNLEIDEGVPYSTRIVYEGFLGSDDIGTLEIPAIILLEPKRPTTNYAVVASGAKSNLYEFVYVKANLTIKSNPMTEIKNKTGEVVDLILKGQYSPYCELDFANVGISPANSVYIQIKQNLDKYYASSGIYNDYKESEAYSINLLIDSIKEENTKSTVTIKLPQRSVGKDKYLVVALYNNGLHEVISGVEKDGYLTFVAADLGNFVVFTPIEGLKTTVLIAIGIGVVGGIILIIILVSIFRRKY